MRNYIALFLSCFLSALCAAQSTPAITSATVNAALARLDPYIRSSLASTKVPGVAVAVVYNDQVVFLRGYGVRRLMGVRCPSKSREPGMFALLSAPTVTRRAP